MTRVFRMRLGSDGLYEPQAIHENVIIIGWLYEDLSNYDTFEKIKPLVQRDFSENSPNSQNIISGMINIFVNEISVGDYVVVKLKNQAIAIGKVDSPYKKGEDNLHLRSVEWCRRDIDESELCSDLQGKLGYTRNTVSNLWIQDAVVRIETIIDTGKDPGPIGRSGIVVSGKDEEPGSCYSVEDIISDGCFVEWERISNILERLRSKKNLILQGPPGTGKTWLAKRLAWALVGQKDEKKVRAVQFHPNLSYEDFVRGWRPSSQGKLDLVDGPFLEIVAAAEEDATGTYVLVIEEVNRGNPAQILGEMLTLLEVDKRNPEDALELTYRREGEQGIYLPPNMHVVGTMNIADRSLALVDLALRRRFAFVDLKPEIGERWKAWVKEQYEFDDAILSDIQERMSSLNETIEADPKLGRQFQIGHSYVTPLPGRETHPSAWYRDVVESEIGPLLDEYWFDDPDRAAQEKGNLLARLEWL